MNADVFVERYISSEEIEKEKCVEESEIHSSSIRPSRFVDYPGQDRIRGNLEIYVSSSIQRALPLDHVILHGPPGLGKTTLARIIASELGVPFYQTSGPSISRPGDLAGILAGIETRGVFFIDEIHRLSIEVEEVLYSAMEEFSIDIIVGQGPTSRAVKIPVNPFTLIGATTRLASLSSPLLTRFGIQERLDFYDVESLSQILKRNAEIWDMQVDQGGIFELAQRSRGTPRISNRLLRRTRDFADFFGAHKITKEIVVKTLFRLEIDELGLDCMDRKILSIILDRYNGGPVGLDTLSSTIGEEKSTVEDVYEPFLLHKNLLCRGPRGREITKLGKDHLEQTAFKSGNSN